jgi:hypothetical protein
MSEIRCQFCILDTESRVLATAAVGVADFKAKNIRRRLRRKFAIELFLTATRGKVSKIPRRHARSRKEILIRHLGK